ncbi:MAG: M48 family metallopeptidase [Alistipes sp.]|nr:M48 family metallopeptidase [Alistipes sp.]
MKTIFEHPVLGEITLSKSLRARRISISVRPSGAVRLSYPHLVATRQALAFLESKVEWIEDTRRRLADKYSERPTFTAEETEAMRAAAKRTLPQRVEFFARKFGFRYGRVTIRAARSKWGSCTSENNISLSLFLMALPEHLRDYVIIHELCHTVHHNHSPKFHALADRCMGGNEKELRRELRKFSTGR